MARNNRNSATAWPKEDLILSFDAFYSESQCFSSRQKCWKTPPAICVSGGSRSWCISFSIFKKLFQYSLIIDCQNASLEYSEHLRQTFVKRSTWFVVFLCDGRLLLIKRKQQYEVESDQVASQVKANVLRRYLCWAMPSCWCRRSWKRIQTVFWLCHSTFDGCGSAETNNTSKHVRIFTLYMQRDKKKSISPSSFETQTIKHNKNEAKNKKGTVSFLI